MSCETVFDVLDTLCSSGEMSYVFENGKTGKKNVRELAKCEISERGMSGRNQVVLHNLLPEINPGIALWIKSP